MSGHGHVDMMVPDLMRYAVKKLAVVEIHRVDSKCKEADDYVFMWIRMQQIRVTWLQFNSGLIYDLGKFLWFEALGYSLASFL